MFPSPSLGPPLLSPSWSPAFGPWGIPGTGPDELLGAAELLVVELAADGEELDVVLFELLLPPPHPATTRATSPAASNPVSVLWSFELI
jgi:hypothetical protein